MPNINKAYLALIPAVIVVAALLMFIGNNLKTSTNSAVTTNTSTTNNDQISIPTQAKTLAIIGSRCRGCGRCAMIDSEHFELSGRTATVISQSNLDSSSLTNAINACPGNAITLS